MKKLYLNHYHEIWCRGKEQAEFRCSMVKDILNKMKDVKKNMTCSMHDLKNGEWIVVVDCANPVWDVIQVRLNIGRIDSFNYA